MNAEPIHDETAEAAVLGAVIGSPTAWDEVAGVLTPADFWLPAHALLWATAASLYEAGRPVDVVTVATAAQASPELARLGGPMLVRQLVADVTTTANVAYWAQIVADCAARRRLVQASNRIRSYAEDGWDVAEAATRATAELESATGQRRQSGPEPVSELVWPFVDGLDEPRGDVVPTPWPELDDVLNGGAGAGELVFVAARTSVGKTIVGVNWARAAAQSGVPTVVFSLEMTRDEVLSRLVSDVGTVPLVDVVSHRLGSEDRERAKRAADRIAGWPLHIDDSPDLSVADVRSRCRVLTRQGGLGLVVVDYLGLLRAADTRVPRQEQVARMSRELKVLAGDLGVPVVVLHQLNRGPEHRAGGRPVKADLRDSGATEQDAHKVVLLWRPDEKPGELVVIVDKHRNGPTGEVTLTFAGHYARVRSGDPYRM